MVFNLKLKTLDIGVNMFGKGLWAKPQNPKDTSLESNSWTHVFSLDRETS